jgi:hypothetical protein
VHCKPGPILDKVTKRRMSIFQAREDSIALRAGGFLSTLAVGIPAVLSALF